MLYAAETLVPSPTSEKYILIWEDGGRSLGEKWKDAFDTIPNRVPMFISLTTFTDFDRAAGEKERGNKREGSAQVQVGKSRIALS